MKKPKMTAAMRAAEKRRKAEEAAAEEAASQDWEPRDDYTLFALVTTLGETSRVFEAVAETMRMSVTTLRARLKRLKGDAAEKPKRPGETGETLAVTFARAEEAVRSGATANAEYRAAAACVAVARWSGVYHEHLASGAHSRRRHARLAEEGRQRSAPLAQLSR